MISEIATDFWDWHYDYLKVSKLWYLDASNDPGYGYLNNQLSSFKMTGMGSRYFTKIQLEITLVFRDKEFKDKDDGV